MQNSNFPCHSKWSCNIHIYQVFIIEINHIFVHFRKILISPTRSRSLVESSKSSRTEPRLSLRTVFATHLTSQLLRAGCLLYAPYALSFSTYPWHWLVSELPALFYKLIWPVFTGNKGKRYGLCFLWVLFFCACFFFLLSRVVKDFMHVCFMQVRTSDLLRHPQEIWTLRTCNKIFSFKSCIDTAFLHFRRSLHASNSKQKLWSKW